MKVKETYVRETNFLSQYPNITPLDLPNITLNNVYIRFV